MSRPGTTITRTTTRSSRSPRTNTGPSFVAGNTAQADAGDGPTKPIYSLADYVARFGARTGAERTYDGVDKYFREGGSELFLSPYTDGMDDPSTASAVTSALALYSDDLGPGQIWVPGVTTTEGHVAMLEAAEAGNRVALLDGVDSGTASTHTAAVSAIANAATAEQLRYGAYFAPWVTVPGLTASSTLDIAPSAIVAGIISRNDGHNVSQNQPSAGDPEGLSYTALKATQLFPQSDVSTMLVNGANVLKEMYNGVQVYGYRTLVDADADALWVNFAGARLFMAIQAQADSIANRYVFKELDPEFKAVTRYGGELTSMLKGFGTSIWSFRVDVLDPINTVSSMAGGVLKAIMTLSTSEAAEEVRLELVKTQTTEVLS